MGKEVNEFRIEALQTHIGCEMYMNKFIYDFFFTPNNEYTFVFTPLILDRLSFSKKIQIIENLFKHSSNLHILKKRYPSINFNVKGLKIIGFSIKKEKYSIKELIKALSKINTIRNHLAHNSVFDYSKHKGMFPVEKFPMNMEYKGNKKELLESREYVNSFFKHFKEITF
mgnify:CR=1 FL=1|jgi:hypothetical protein